jgi:sugar transferase (PEP-CTERM/EpsH1 system associated)
MRILWLKTELLHPIDKGGKIRTYQLLKALKARHHVTYLTLDDGTAAPDALERAIEYCHEVVRVPFAPAAKRTPAFYLDLARNAVSSLPYAIAKYRVSGMRREIESLVRARQVDLVVCDFLFPSINVPDDLGVPTVLFQHNVEAAIWERHAKVAGTSLARAYLRSQWRRMQAFERAECRRFDHVIAVSDLDRDVFREHYGVASASTAPTGVDTEFFSPSGRVDSVADEIVFTGSMDWMPNEDGIVWFVRDVLPGIRAARPSARLTIVGRNPTPKVRALAEAAPGISVTGSVADIRPYLERASVVIVPLRVGGGTRLKIFEAMAMERAVVATTIGAEGLPVVDGRDLVIADAPAPFASAVTRLLANATERDALAREASRHVRAEFSWSSVAEHFIRDCELAVARHQRRGTRAAVGDAAVHPA